MARGLKLGAQVAEIVDLAIVGQNEAVLDADHRLVGERRQIDDRQPAMAKPHRTFAPVALAVGPAMRDRIGHRLQQFA